MISCNKLKLETHYEHSLNVFSQPGSRNNREVRTEGMSSGEPGPADLWKVGNSKLHNGFITFILIQNQIIGHKSQHAAQILSTGDFIKLS